METTPSAVITKPQRPTDPDEIADALKAPFSAKVIGWRMGKTNKEKTRAMALAYVDARDIAKRLDQVLGIHGWKSHHYPVGNAQIACELSILVGGQWISKTDGCWIGDLEGETGAHAGKMDQKQAQALDMEGKGSFSTSLKRAAVHFGIARYLYDMESPWVDIDSNDKNKFAPAALKVLEATASKPFAEWKVKLAEKKAAEAKAAKAAADAQAPTPSPSLVATPTPAQAAESTPLAPQAPPSASAVQAPAPAAAPPAQSHVATTAQTGTYASAGNQPPRTFPRPQGESEMRLAFYLDALSHAPDVEEVKAIGTTAKADTEITGEGTPSSAILREGYTEAMKRLVPGWTPEKNGKKGGSKGAPGAQAPATH